MRVDEAALVQKRGVERPAGCAALGRHAAPSRPRWDAPAGLASH